MRKFMLEDILEKIRRKALEKGFNLLEVETSDGIIRIPLGKINGLAFIEE